MRCNIKIKLRAWLKYEDYPGEMIFSEKIEEKRHVSPAGFYGDSYIDLDKMDIMQWTGLTDKYGIDIYDGDILEFDHDIINSNECIWKNLVHIWISNTLDINMSFNHPYSEMSEKFMNYCGRYAENNKSWPNSRIVGNIYENPELMENKN